MFVHISGVKQARLSGLKEGQVVEYEEVANSGKASVENPQGLTLRVPSHGRGRRFNPYIAHQQHTVLVAVRRHYGIVLRVVTHPSTCEIRKTKGSS